MEIGSVVDWLGFSVALIGLLVVIILEWDKLAKRYSHAKKEFRKRQIPDIAITLATLIIAVITAMAYLIVATSIFGFILTTMRDLNFPTILQVLGLLIGGSLIVYAIVEIVDRFI